MAEETEQHEKTEEPTPKKLDEGRRKGNVAASREVNHWFIIMAAAIALMVTVPGMFRDIGAALSWVVANSGTAPVEGAGISSILSKTVTDIGLSILPFFILLIIAAIGAGVIQNGFMFSSESIIPKLEKISVFKGVKRLFSARSLVEFAKGILKLAIVGTVVVMVLLPSFGELELSITMTMVDVLGTMRDLALRVLIAVLAVMTVIMVLDVLYQRFEHMKKMRMSRQEIKEEFKQTEGDPHVKARLRQIRMERARRRMISKVPEADVVVTNPTHYSVALTYDGDTMEAPRVVAKGVDTVALRIREVAEEHDVPIVENPALARALYATVDLDQEIPSEHYRAVAEIISYVMGLKGKPAPA